MPYSTKQVIAQTLMILLDEKPVAKITVKDIVERCGVNRNTFYYHFRDIPDALDYTMRQELDRIFSREIHARTLPEMFFSVIGYLASHQRFILHIYNSLQREAFIHYMRGIADYMTRQALCSFTPDSGISPEEFETVCFTCKCFLEGILLDWLDSGMDYDLMGRLKASGYLLTHKWNVLLMAAYAGYSGSESPESEKTKSE